MQIIQDRRALHQIPELEWQLPKTMAYIKNSLSGLNCQILEPQAGALCAFFDFGKKDAIAFRADCDALPVTEVNQVPYASTHPGRMHACGHDGHTAMLLELARRLNEKQQLPHNVLLVFQPGEESPGGAKAICDTGIFEKYQVKAIFGQHIWPGLPEGEIFSREMELMSRSCEVNVDIYGKSAHIAKANDAIDAIAAMVEFYRQVTAMEQALPPEIFRLLKFGKMEGGTVRNVISNHARLEGSLRAFQDEIFEGLRDGLLEAARNVENTFGCTAELSFSDGYPAILNPAQLCERVRAVYPYRLLDQPSMTSEDFSWYQRYLPGMFFFLGAGDVPALHAHDFHFNETILTKGADFFEVLAEKFQ